MRKASPLNSGLPPGKSSPYLSSWRRRLSISVARRSVSDKPTFRTCVCRGPQTALWKAKDDVLGGLFWADGWLFGNWSTTEVAERGRPADDPRCSPGGSPSLESCEPGRLSRADRTRCCIRGGRVVRFRSRRDRIPSHSWEDRRARRSPPRVCAALHRPEQSLA